jgi:hypothetical protein
VFGLSLKAFLDRFDEVSVRLRNGIAYAASEDRLPYPTLESYLRAGPERIGHMLRLPMLGKKSVLEFDELATRGGANPCVAAHSAEPVGAPLPNDASPARGSVYDLALNAFLELYDDVSMRLQNAVRYGAREDRLPYPTLRAYLQAGPERIEQMLRLPALGRKTALEFEALALRATAEFRLDALGVEGAGGAAPASAKVNAIDPLFAIGLDSFLAVQPIVSARLMHAIQAGILRGDCPFSTVSTYLLAGEQGLAQLCKLPNLGAASAREFDSLVRDAVRYGALVPPPRLALNAQGFPDLEQLMQSVFDALDERETKILLDRVATAADIDTIARELGLTRGRIHQIERALFTKLVAKFAQAFLQSLVAIDAQLRQRGLREIALHAFAELTGADVITCELYLKCLRKFGVDEPETLALRDRGHLYRPAEFAPSDSWDRRVDQALIETQWPLVFTDFLAQVHDVPRYAVERRIVERYHARLAADTFLELPRMGVPRMCLQVLASTRAPMHLGAIRAALLKHFGVDLTLQHVTGTLSAHADIATCGWGMYVRYVDLPYTDAGIARIRDHMHEALHTRQVFVSSKILFEQLFATDIADYPDGFNHYLLLGFAQGDRRFTVKRGNMIGLACFELAKTYMSLEHEVCNIVLEHGPISVPDILSHLAATRKLCNGTHVRLSLAKSAEIIQVGRRLYDSLYRVFTDHAEYDALMLALRIALLTGTKSVYALATEMATLGLGKASTEVIGSILGAVDDVAEADGMYRLTAPGPDLERYQAIALASLANGGLERLRGEAAAAFGSDVAARFIGFDRRFSTSPVPRQSDTGSSALHALLADFEF